MSKILTLASVKSPTDMDNIRLVLQGYNFGDAYIHWAIKENIRKYVNYPDLRLMPKRSELVKALID